MKSVIRRFIALILLVVLFPIFCVIGMIIWLHDGEPILFLQERVGHQQKIFLIYKFRTMYRKVKADDPDRVTSPGIFLRRTHLDELPQLWNIVRGEMVFIGPRPTPLNQVKVYARLYPRRYNNRFILKPGVTGLAQIHLEKGDCNNLFKCIAWEEFYRQRKSFFLDIVIITKTLFKMSRGTSS